MLRQVCRSWLFEPTLKSAPDLHNLQGVGRCPASSLMECWLANVSRFTEGICHARPVPQEERVDPHR